jgi:hypothetical protein
VFICINLTPSGINTLRREMMDLKDQSSSSYLNPLFLAPLVQRKIKLKKSTTNNNHGYQVADLIPYFNSPTTLPAPPSQV